jgi:large subunit ribosomal protein L19
VSSVVQKIEEKFKKPHIVDVRSGDTVRVHQKVREGNKERVQVFEGLVIRTDRKKSHTASITVRRVASGIGVEKTYLMHSPLISKIEVVKRSKVRRNYLSYMRERTGKSARLSSVDFDKEEVNKEPEAPAEPAEKEAKVPEQPEEKSETKAPAKEEPAKDVEQTDSKEKAAK